MCDDFQEDGNPQKLESSFLVFSVMVEEVLAEVFLGGFEMPLETAF